jgi:hypothetical protein
MAETAIPMPGVLRVVSNADLDRMEAERLKAQMAAQAPQDQAMTDLAAFIRRQFEMMKRHRSSASGWNNRLLKAMRVFNGEYDPEQLSAIRQFGGSEIYARLIAMKCRGASSLLRDVYLGQNRPWSVAPPQDPDVPQKVIDDLQKLIMTEVQTIQMGGQPVDVEQVRDRTKQLFEAARDAAKQARIAEDKIDELLSRGGFYRALAEFITDLPLFPFAVLKGPVVRITPQVIWDEAGNPTTEQVPTLHWMRISPFDVWWTPGVTDVEDASFIERTRVTRAELNDLLDLPGYNAEAVRKVLDEYGRGGLTDNWDDTDAERAVQESREDPMMNQSGLINCLEFHGNVQGRTLLDWGMDAGQITDDMRDYFVQAWLIGRHVIKVQMSPSPRKRHPYYVTSFEKVPGTPVGNGLPDILHDIGDVANATLRALVNNLSLSSGPQVVIRADRVAPGEDPTKLYPWKQWFMNADPFGNSSSEKPVDFFQPQSNANELLGVYKAFADMADELSAIPKYLSGQGAGSGAGRTASGLAMLMGNASKILQTVAANIDRDVMEPALSELTDLVKLTDTTGLLNGQEKVRVLGVSVAVQKETQRARQLEFLTTTANPIDMQIMGPGGRAVVLKSVADTIGLDGEQIVPDRQQIEAAMQQQAQMAAQQPPPEGAQGGTPAKSPVTGDMGPRTNLQQQRPQPTIGGGVG